MSAWWLGLLLAVLLFWSVGAYNRLMRLRARVSQAFAALDERLVQQLTWVQGCLPLDELGEASSMGAETPALAAWRHLRAASEQLTHSLTAARARPLEPRATAALTAARGVLNTSWQRVGALGDLREATVPEAWRAEHEQLLGQILLRCEAFNQAARAYNDAIAQFPALLLARVFGFRPAGVMQPMALVG